MFAEQLADGVEPDVITYASLLSACERTGDVDKAMAVLDEMHARGLSGPANMYNSVIAACGARWGRALEVFLTMQCVGVGVGSQTINLLMASLCAGGQRQQALWLLRQAQTARLPVSATGYTSLLRLLSGVGDWRSADLVHARMRADSLVPDATAASLMLAAHDDGGNEAGAAQLRAYFAKMGYIIEAPNLQEKSSSGGDAPAANRAVHVAGAAAGMPAEEHGSEHGGEASPTAGSSASHTTEDN